VKSQWIEHLGKKVLYADYANFDTKVDLFQTEVDAVTESITSEPDSSVRLLVDVRGTPGTPEIMNILYTSAKACNPHMIATAVVGVGGIRMMLMRSVTRITGMPLTAIETVDEAMDWLVNQ
jgi:hypothetical protein